MDMVGKIRRLHSRGKKSEREIARLTGLSRNTVAKWLKEPAGAPPKYRRATVVGKLTPFAEAIEQALQADAHRPRRTGARSRRCTRRSPRRATLAVIRRRPQI